MDVRAFHFLATAVAGWANQHQQVIIDYLIEENRIFNAPTPGSSAVSV
jgi:hypothetical protein